ncbi:MAG: tetratricopeptide repeat protein [Rhodanobacteraceae bacterium]
MRRRIKVSTLSRTVGFVAELRRRHVLRAGALYAAATWALAQGIAQLGPSFGAPDWVARWFVIACVIGFPFWLAFAWFYEFTPEGLKRESEIAPSDSITHHTGKKLDFTIIGVLALAVVLLLTDRFVLRHGVNQTAPAVAAAPIPDIEKDPSIAVLPFVDMSQGKDQEYFSDGISEELLNLLAKIPKLRVIARTSSFSFKGKDVDIAYIARKLNVAALLEGSVRKSGNTVRITVQLIRASDSSHLWSERYDRTLGDIFKVQDEIAATVVDKLKITLLGAVPTVRPIDPMAYPLILQAKAVATQSSAKGLEQAIALYQQALAIAPDEPRAWSGLGRVYMNQVAFSIRPSKEGTRRAEEALKKAVTLDPDDALTYGLLGFLYSQLQNERAAAAPFYEKALALDPRNAHIIGGVGIFLENLGRLEEASKLLEYEVSHDPANPNSYSNLGSVYYYAGRWDEAITTGRTVLALSQGYAQMHSSIGIAMLLAKGDPAEALKEMQAEPEDLAKRTGMVMALHTLGRKAEADAAMSALIAQHANDGSVFIANACAWRGEVDRAFEWLDKAISTQDPSLASIHLEPLFASLHNDPRWLPLLRTLGQAPEQLAKIEFKVTLPGADATP